MNASYPATSQVVNLCPSTGALSFYRWLYRWHSQTGVVAPSTGYLAHKQGKTERTIYRWLSELRSCSYIATEVESGVARRIVPLVAPSPGRRRVQARASASPGSEIRCTENRKQYETVESVTPKMSGVLSGVLSGVYPVDSHTQETTTDNQVAASPLLSDGCYQVGASPLPEVDCENVAASPLPESPVFLALCDAGVTASTAVQLLTERGERECLEQLESLPYRKPKEAAAVLVASIRGRWAMPGALVREREKQRREADRRARVQARAIVQKHQRQVQAASLDRLSALPGTLYASLEARAVSLWHQEQPAAARIMQGRCGASAVVHGYMLRILEGEGGGVHA